MAPPRNPNPAFPKFGFEPVYAPLRASMISIFIAATPHSQYNSNGALKVRWTFA